MPTVFLTEIHGIQEYLSAGGKLKDAVAASDLLDQLWSERFLGKVLQAANAEPDKAHVIRRAGGAFVALYPDAATAQRLKALWLLFVAQALPGVNCVADVASGDTLEDALSKGYRALQQQRNHPLPDLPGASPLTVLNQRTGHSAVRKDPSPPPGEEAELMDASMTVKRAHFKAMKSEDSALEEKFGSYKEVHWPRNMDEDFTAHGSDVAVIHADGNGLGVCLHQINIYGKTLQNEDKSCQLKREFSKILLEAGEAAARNATQRVLSKHIYNQIMPARPLVLGGDDLTIIVRADLAMEFTQTFCKTFEEASKKGLKQLRKDFPQLTNLPPTLTICAGVAFVKVNQPFSGSYKLAESLCDFAKKQGRAIVQGRVKKQGQVNIQDRDHEQHNLIPSAIAFHRPGASLFDEYDTILKRDMTVKIDGRPLRLSAGVYGINDAQNVFPNLDALLNAVEHLQTHATLTASPLRSLANRLYRTPGLAYHNYQRWWDNMKNMEKQDKKANHSALEAVHTELKAVLDEEDFSEGQFPEKKNEGWSPLGDMLTLYHIANKSIRNAEA